MEGRVESKAPDQRALIEGDSHKNPQQVPQPSYPGVPFTSTGSADADSLLRCILFGSRDPYTVEREIDPRDQRRREADEYERPSPDVQDIIEAVGAIRNRLPYPWCSGAPTKADCIARGYCLRNPSCGE